MKKLIILFLLISNLAAAQGVKKLFKFSTFYVAANGGTSLSDVNVFSVNNGLSTNVIKEKTKSDPDYEECLSCQ